MNWKQKSQFLLFAMALFFLSLKGKSQATELQPQFFETGNTLDIYYNLEAWNTSNTPWANNYDHLGQMNLSWDGVIFYRAEHSGLYSNSLSTIDYTISQPSETRYEQTSVYDIYTKKTIENDITVTYTNTVAYGTSFEVTQVHISIPKSALAKLQAADVTDSLEMYAYYYMRSPGGNSNSPAGTHNSSSMTIQGYEEDPYGLDELDFTANLNSDQGFVQLKFRAETRDSEDVYDYAKCLYFVEVNNTDNTTKIIAQLGHNNLSCTHPTGYPTYTTTGIGGDNYTFSVYDNNKVDVTEVKRTHSPTSWHFFQYDNGIDDDAYFVVDYYLDAEDFSDDIEYYVDGYYYVRDNYGVSNSVLTQWWWGNQTKSIKGNDNYSLPVISNLAASASSTQCQIDLTWSSFSNFAVASKEFTGVYRDGILIGKVLNSSTPTFTDTNVVAGQNYSYQVGSLYERNYNNDFKGLLSPAVTEALSLANSPTGITLTQGSCGSDIQVDWVWTGTDPASFSIQRKTETTNFTSLVTGVAGGARSFIDNNSITSGEVYTYRLAAVDNICNQEGNYSGAVTLTGDTVDLSLTLEETALTTSKGYFNNRTELNWSTTSNNNQYINRFRIYARELGSTVLPTLLQTVDETQISWTHLTGNAGVVYEYFLVAERVVVTQCGSVVTKSFEIGSLENTTSTAALPSNGLGVATAVGFRFPTAVVNGNISYTGGVAVPDVKVIAEKYSGQNGSSLYFDGTADYVSVPHSSTTMPDTAFTISMWVKPESLGSSVLFQKNGSFGIEYNGVSKKPFIFIRDTTYYAHTLSGDTGIMKIGTWANLTATYSSSTGVMKLYVNGILSSATTTIPANLRQINLSTTPTYIGCQNNGTLDYFFQGYIDEVKLYNRELTAEEVKRSAGAVSATDANGLQAYWKFFVGVGNQVYDAAHHGSVYHKNDGVIAGASWSNEIPPVSKLGYAGYTDANGNYSISGIGYSNSGENFNIIPTATLAGAVHEFDPTTRTLYVGDGANIHNNIDFDDVSSFTVQGNVKYLFNNIDTVNFKSAGSAGIRLYLNGQTALTGAGNQIIETDENGFFSVDIPIGQHFIEFRKNGHTIQNSGRFPATGTWDFQGDITGLEIWDETLHILAGKVVGGTTEADKLLGFNQTNNNIGQAFFTVTSTDGKIIRTITTDSLTGEYFIDLPPKKYNVSSVKWTANNVDIINSGNITPIELGSISSYQLVQEIDTINTDTTKYNVRKDFVYRVSPELVVSDTSGSGMPSETHFPIITGNTNDTILVDLTSLRYPVYKSGSHYQLKMKAVELYNNLDNNRNDTVPVNDGLLTINNGIGEGYHIDEDNNKVAYASPEIIDINDGEILYNFQCMEPNINENSSSGLEHLSYTKQMSINLQVGSYQVTWINSIDTSSTLKAYVLGAAPVGNSFVTEAPTQVEYVLRDPPGSNSTALWSQGSSHTVSSEYYEGGFSNISLNATLGIGGNTLVGGGICGVGETAEYHAVGVLGFDIGYDWGSGGEYSKTTTFDQTIETSDLTDLVGQSGDIFIANSQNLQTGLAVQIQPVPLNDCGGNCYGDTMYSTKGDTFRMTRVISSYINPVGTPTYFVYSQNHIENVLIPSLETVRNSFFSNNADFTSVLAPNHANYGTNNDDPVWGTSASSTNYIRTESADFTGSSYTFNWNNDSSKVDSVRWVNQQIRLWKEALADNEIAKWEAITYSTPQNISIASGVSLTQTSSSVESTFSYRSFEFSASLSAGVSAAFQGYGFQTSIDLMGEVGYSKSGQDGEGNETTTTTSFTLLDQDQDDTYSIDIFPANGSNGTIYSVVGGKTMCPFEGATHMEFTTPEYVQTLIHAATGQISRAQQEATAFGLMGASAEQVNALSELSSVQTSVTRLTALKAALIAGNVELNAATQQRDKPEILINGASTAQMYNIPATQNANFTLLLNNLSESLDGMDYEVEVLDGTNPNGLQLSIDGTSIVNPVAFTVPGGSSLQKILTVARGPFDYNYTNVGVIIHSSCQYDPNGNADLIVDTVFFDVNFIPTCSDVVIVSPDDQFVVNNSFGGEVPITIGGYDVNFQDFEHIKVQYKSSSSSNWTLLESYYRDTNTVGWTNEPTLPQTGNTFTYDWALGQLPDGNYDLRAVATCALASTNSTIHSGVVDRLNIKPFGQPQPSDGILSPGEEISIQFNEPINAGMFIASNIDVRAVLNGGDVRHDASVYFGGVVTNNVEIPQVNLANRSFTIEFYAKRTVNGVNQTIISQGFSAAIDLSIGFNTANQLVFDLGANQIVGTSATNNNWHHYSVSYNKDTYNADIFIDGILDKNVANFTTSYTQNDNLIIGKSSAGSTVPFTGNVHELRIWSKVLTSGQINISAVKRMVGNEQGLYLNWEMEEAHGNVVNDKVRGKHGVMNATWSVSPAGYGLALNGTTNQAEIPTIAFDSSADYTIEFWFKSTSTDEVLLSNGTGDNTDPNTSGWALGLNTNGNFEAKSNDEVLTSTMTVNDALWHHASLVVSARGNAVLYVDAAQQAAITNDSLNGFSGTKLWIGQRGWVDSSVVYQDKQFTGNMDEIRIWEVARSLDQIDRDRFNKLTGNEPGLRRYYAFENYTTNAGQTTVAADTINGVLNAPVGSAIVLNSGATMNQITPPIKLKRPVQAVPFSYVINNDKIIITPTIADASIENVQLDFTISHVQDLNANVLESPVTWSAYVDRNQVVWLDDMFAFDTLQGSQLSFTSSVVNNSGASASFNISNLPSWMSASITSGFVGPLATLPITFTIPASVNAGTYQQDVLLTTSFGFAEQLDVNLKVRQIPPAGWTVDPSQFQYSMNIIGQIAIDSIISRNEEDLLAVFVNNQCRGVRQLQYLNAYDNYQSFLTIYGDTSAGDTLDFRIWESTTGAIHPVVVHNLPSQTFVVNAFYGSGATPETFYANNYLYGEIDVPQGWKWIAFNLEGADLTNVNTLLGNLNATTGDQFKTRTAEPNGSGGYSQSTQTDTYLSGLGWSGGVSDSGGVEIGYLYKIQSVNSGKITYEGELVQPELDTLHIITGWNYLGYLGNVNTSVTVGLSNLTPSNGDVVKSQYQSAIYDASFGWIGSLTTLEPNTGYMYKSATDQDFTFPISVAQKTNFPAFNNNELQAISPWDFNYHQYPSNMTIVAKIANDDDQFNAYHSNTGVIGAFVDGECRGVGLPIENEESGEIMYFITVNGVSATDEVSFKFLDRENQFQYTALESTLFTSNGLTGSVSAPFELNLPESNVKVATNQDFGVYPNPFSTETQVRVFVNRATNIDMIVEDLTGKVVRSVHFGEVQAGEFNTSISAAQLPQGSYILHLTVGTEVFIQKLIITK